MAASPRGDPSPNPGRAEWLEQLEDEARRHRNRLRLYRARLHSGRLGSVERLKELERISDLAESRLARAKSEKPGGDESAS